MGATFPFFCSFDDQRAQVVVSMNLRREQGNLSFAQLVALFHEFGHALTYLLSSTKYQTLSGARSLSTEYLEFPSHFFEFFLFDPFFLKYVLLDNQMIAAAHMPMKKPLFSQLHSLQKINDSLLDLALFGDQSKQSQSIQELSADAYKGKALLLKNESESDCEQALHGYLLRASRFHH